MTLDPTLAIKRYGKDHTVSRRLAETYDANGRAVQAAAQDLTIFMSVQPVDGRELRNLPEAQHGEEIRVARSFLELKMRDGTYAPDVVTIKDEPWVVVRTKEWPRHWESYLSRAVVS